MAPKPPLSPIQSAQSSDTTLFFDKQDYDLLSIIDHALDTSSTQGQRERSTFSAHLHPHGILELASTHTERMARAVINLLGSLEDGQAEDRLTALRSLHDEVLHSAQTTFRYNTGRVLIQMMKEIVRSRGRVRSAGDDEHRLMLAHDFRRAVTGNPRVVRRFLRQYHLLEMPEAWNQLAMDHHVHDSNTKGRKNPTHLIMDAWIKGLRFLTVIYYNYVTPEAVSELVRAADIMRISLRIGLEYRVPFRDKDISLVWVPRGFADEDALFDFLAEPGVAHLVHEGRKASDFAAATVLRALDYWNSDVRPVMNANFEVDSPPIDREHFLRFVGKGQASFLHLAEVVHRWMLPSLRLRYQELERLTCSPDSPENPAAEERARRMAELNSLTPEIVLHTWLPDRPQLPTPPEGSPPLPEIMTLAPQFLVDWLLSLRPSSHIWLNLSGLSPEDVVELLWDCKGKITHLEIFNLKEWQEGSTPHLEEISLLQQAINAGGPLHLKQCILALLREKGRLDASRTEKMRVILRNLRALQAPYLQTRLRSRIGTDSTSNSSMRHGMGLVLPETLPVRAQRQLRREGEDVHLRLPIMLSIFPRVNYMPPRRNALLNPRFVSWVRRVTGSRRFGSHKKWEWLIYSDTVRILQPGQAGNVVTMGGIGGGVDNGFSHSSPQRERTTPGLSYLNTPTANTLKVGLGFVAAMLTFLHTQSWWVLAWYGAVIWFAITALRNVIQAVLSGGGIIHTSLLRWNEYVNGNRVCDSLMYTGFSVPLLEYVIRVLLLEQVCGISVATNPMAVFTAMAIANGLYIAAHNIYRGFPIEAIIGNIFRSVLAIPCSILYYNSLLALLPLCGVANPLLYLTLGAAVVSKAASDTVAGVIEGFADRRNNLRLRYWDYRTKLLQLVDTYSRMELAYPEADILRLLARPKSLLRFTEEAGKTLHVAAIIHALDLMYFWNYQPQGQQAMRRILHLLTPEERLILVRSQLVLTRIREISQLFVDGLVGDHFARALAFYLDQHEAYIRAIRAACAEVDSLKNTTPDMEQDESNEENILEGSAEISVEGSQENGDGNCGENTVQHSTKDTTTRYMSATAEHKVPDTTRLARNATPPERRALERDKL